MRQWFDRRSAEFADIGRCICPVPLGGGGLGRYTPVSGRPREGVTEASRLSQVLGIVAMARDRPSRRLRGVPEAAVSNRNEGLGLGVAPEFPLAYTHSLTRFCPRGSSGPSI
jgi:hypothetical protein